MAWLWLLLLWGNAHYQLLNHKTQTLHFYEGSGGRVLCAPAVGRPSGAGRGQEGGWGATPVWPWVLGSGRATARDQTAAAPRTCPPSLDSVHLPAPYLTASLPVGNGKERHPGHEVDGYFLPCSWGRIKHILQFFRVPCDPSRRMKQTTHTTVRTGSERCAAWGRAGSAARASPDSSDSSWQQQPGLSAAALRADGYILFLFWGEGSILPLMTPGVLAQLFSFILKEKMT